MEPIKLDRFTALAALAITAGAAVGRNRQTKSNPPLRVRYTCGSTHPIQHGESALQGHNDAPRGSPSAWLHRMHPKPASASTLYVKPSSSAESTVIQPTGRCVQDCRLRGEDLSPPYPCKLAQRWQLWTRSNHCWRGGEQAVSRLSSAAFSRKRPPS